MEQKNSSLVRAYLGFDHLDTVEQTNRLNQPYDRMWIYYNLVQPVMRLEEKTITPLDNGRSRVRRRYDEVCTPFDRLDRTGRLAPETRARLSKLRSETNPASSEPRSDAGLTNFNGFPGQEKASARTSIKPYSPDPTGGGKARTAR